MDYLSRLSIPQERLPQWLLLVGGIASLNALQNIFSPKFSTKVYSSPTGIAQGASLLTVTPLSARMFAVWNLTSAMRASLADSAYVLCAGTFVIALVHFVSELLVFRTAKLSAGSVSPLIVASMVKQFSFYIS